MPNTPVPAAGEAVPASNLLTRRILLGSISSIPALGGLALLPAATGAAPALPAPADQTGKSAGLDTEPSPIVALYARWKAALDEPYDDEDEKKNAAIFERLCAVEDELAAEPARDFRDFTLKVRALSSIDGRGYSDDYQASLFSDARTLIAEAGL